jgi:hypothetical protein
LKRGGDGKDGQKKKKTSDSFGWVRLGSVEFGSFCSEQEAAEFTERSRAGGGRIPWWSRQPACNRKEGGLGGLRAVTT